MQIAINEEVYVPFWIIIEYLDISPPDPFVLCKVTDIYKGASIGGKSAVDICDLYIKKDITAETVLMNHLIKKEDIEAWANRIGNWFKDFPDTI